MVQNYEDEHCVHQMFVADDQSAYENADGEPIDPDEEFDFEPIYQPFHMVHPCFEELCERGNVLLVSGEEGSMVSWLKMEDGNRLEVAWNPRNYPSLSVKTVGLDDEALARHINVELGGWYVRTCNIDNVMMTDGVAFDRQGEEHNVNAVMEQTSTLVTNINWDIDDNVEGDVVLPSAVEIVYPVELEDETEIEGRIADWLSDHYGWCVSSFDHQLDIQGDKPDVEYEIIYQEE